MTKKRKGNMKTNRTMMVLHYVTKPAAPGMDFFVIVNDDSGKAELWVP